MALSLAVRLGGLDGLGHEAQMRIQSSPLGASTAGGLPDQACESDWPTPGPSSPILAMGEDRRKGCAHGVMDAQHGEKCSKAFGMGFQANANRMASITAL